MKIIANICLALAFVLALGGVANTRWGNDLITPSYETLLGKTLEVEKQEYEKSRALKKFIQAQSDLRNLKAGEPAKTILRDDDEGAASIVETELKLAKVVSERRTKMQWFFISGGFFAIIGLICRVSSNLQRVVPSPETTACPFCAEDISTSAEFCPKCGKHLSSEPIPSPVETPDRQVFITRDNQQLGPYSIPQMREMLQTKAVFPMDMVWFEGMDEWKPYYAVPELQEARQETTPVHSPTSSTFNRDASPDIITEEDMKAFIGYGYKSYLRTWKRLNNNKAFWKRITFNIGALLIGPFWLWHRKMYRMMLWCFLIIFVLPIIAAIYQSHICSAFAASIEHFTDFLAGLCALTLIFWGSKFYLKHAETCITECKRRIRNRKAQLASIANIGGHTNWAGVGLLGFFLLVFYMKISGLSNAPQASKAEQFANNTAKTPQPTPAPSPATQQPKRSISIPKEYIGSLIALSERHGDAETDYGNGKHIGQITASHIFFYANMCKVASVTQEQRPPFGDGYAIYTDSLEFFIVPSASYTMPDGVGFILAVTDGKRVTSFVEIKGETAFDRRSMQALKTNGYENVRKLDKMPLQFNGELIALYARSREGVEAEYGAGKPIGSISKNIVSLNGKQYTILSAYAGEKGKEKIHYLHSVEMGFLLRTNVPFNEIKHLEARFMLEAVPSAAQYGSGSTIEIK